MKEIVLLALSTITAAGVAIVILPNISSSNNIPQDHQQPTTLSASSMHTGLPKVPSAKSTATSTRTLVTCTMRGEASHSLESIGKSITSSTNGLSISGKTV